MDSEHRQDAMPASGTNNAPALSPAQQQAVRQIEQMTPEQRKELQSRLAEMPLEQRTAVEETLRLYAQQVAMQEAAHASLMRAMWRDTSAQTQADTPWQAQPAVAAAPHADDPTAHADHAAPQQRDSASKAADRAATGTPASAPPVAAQTVTQTAATSANSSGTAPQAASTQAATPQPGSAQTTAQTAAAQPGAQSPAAKTAEVREVAPTVKTAQFGREESQPEAPKRRRKEKTEKAQSSQKVGHSSKADKPKSPVKEPPQMQTPATQQTAAAIGQPADSPAPIQTAQPQTTPTQTAQLQAPQTQTLPLQAEAAVQAGAPKNTAAQPSTAQTASMQPITKQTAATKAASKKTSSVRTQDIKERFRLFAERMQRGANDGALVEAREADALPPRLVYNALGQVLYSIGLETEYICVQFIRTMRRVAIFAGVTISSVLQAILRPLWMLVRGVSRDISEPFVRVFSGTRNLFRVMSQAKHNGENAFSAGAQFLKRGLASYRKLLTASLSYLLPLTAAGIFALTAWSVLGREYSLEVHYNGEFLAFVENESVWEDAQKMVRSRIRAGSGEDFTAHPELIVRAVNTAARTNSRDLADDLIEASSDQIRKATGVYVNDTLVGVCDDIAGVQRMLNNALNAARNGEEDETLRTSFVQNVSQIDGVYLTSSVIPLAQLESNMLANNWLQVQVLRTITFEEALSFPTVEQENSKLYKGSTKVLQKGVDGLQEVTADVAYIDGQEVGRTVLSTNVLVEAVPKIVEVGTKQFSSMYDGPITPGSGIMIWPVPDYTYTTTEYGRGGHRGLDICAPYGAPVYACDGGTVITAGWHGSYGNYIQIDHGNGIVTLYAHNSALLVGVGQTVAPGQVIAQVGSTGNSSGNHVHLEIYVNGGRTNPRSYVSP